MTNAAIIELPNLEHIDAWDPPLLFQTTETPEISAQYLPAIFGEFAAQLSQATETPEALSVMMVLSVLATVFAKKVWVCPKANWHEPVNIYTVIALPPANHKSLVLNVCISPLIAWEKMQAAKLAADIKRLESERKTQEKIIEAMRHKAAKLIEPHEQQAFMKMIADKEAALAELPIIPVLFTNDATPESLTGLIHQQGGRLAIFSDEGGILETLSGLYSQGMANVDILLKGIDGGEVRVHRKDRSLILNPYLTIALVVQPAIIEKMGKKSVFLGNGSLERFLYVLPKSKLGYRSHNQPPVSAAMQAAYHAKITQLLNQFLPAEKPIQLLQLSAEAQQLWQAFQGQIEIQLRPGGRLSSCQGWGGKISGFALRIAGVLHTAAYESQSLSIHETTMKNALEIAQALTEHALAAFGLMGADPAQADAQAIFDWIKNHQKRFFTRSEILLAMRNKKFSKAEYLLKALHVLQERNLISGPVKLPTRKPTTRYYVNPLIYSDKK